MVEATDGSARELEAIGVEVAGTTTVTTAVVTTVAVETDIDTDTGGGSEGTADGAEAREEAEEDEEVVEAEAEDETGTGEDDTVSIDEEAADVAATTGGSPRKGLGMKVEFGLGGGRPDGYESWKMSFCAPSRKLYMSRYRGGE